MKTQYDHETRYCPMLGHEMNFYYCRTTHNHTLCRKIMDCWHQRLPIGTFLQENFTENELSVISKTPQDKITTIMQLINQAQKEK